MSFTITNLKELLILSSSLSLVACFGGGLSIPDDHYYRLPEILATKISSPILDGTLSIKRVITHGIYGERTLIYTDRDNSLKLNRYHYHHWEKSPSKLIQDHFVQYLKKVGIAQQVMSQTQNISANYLLEVELISMHRDMSNGEYIAAIALDIRLYNKKNNSVYINKRYHSKKLANSDKLVDTIFAYGAGLHGIYDTLILDISLLQNKNINLTDSHDTFQPAAR